MGRETARFGAVRPRFRIEEIDPEVGQRALSQRTRPVSVLNTQLYRRGERVYVSLPHTASMRAVPTTQLGTPSFLLPAFPLLSTFWRSAVAKRASAFSEN
mgnify:CR=1 FL=1